MASVANSVIGLAGDLDRDLLHGQRDGRLGLGRLDPHVLHVEVVDEAVGDGRAQALERLVGALLRHQRDELAHLGVVDGVLDHVGDRRVGLPHVEAEVEHQPLADLALGLGHPVAREQLQAGDLDGDDGLAAIALVIVVIVVEAGFEVVVVGVVGHRGRTVAAATVSASTLGATSWTRKTVAPRSRARTLVATVPATRSAATSRPVSLPRNDLRDVPITSGRPSAASSSRRRSSSRLCSSVLPKPMPGSSSTRSSATPWPVAYSRRASRNALTSATTSS